jgi:hypothetical protein
MQKLLRLCTLAEYKKYHHGATNVPELFSPTQMINIPTMIRTPEMPVGKPGSHRRRG